MQNMFFVSVLGGCITILRPLPKVMTREQALNLAASIVAVTDEEEFARVLEAIKNN